MWINEQASLVQPLNPVTHHDRAVKNNTHIANYSALLLAITVGKITSSFILFLTSWLVIWLIFSSTLTLSRAIIIGLKIIEHRSQSLQKHCAKKESWDYAWVYAAIIMSAIFFSSWLLGQWLS